MSKLLNLLLNPATIEKGYEWDCNHMFNQNSENERRMLMAADRIEILEAEITKAIDVLTADYSDIPQACELLYKVLETE